MEAIQEMLDDLTKKYNDGEVREEWAVHDYEGIPSTLASEYMGEQDFQQIYDIAEVAEESGVPLEVLMERAGDTGSDDYKGLAESLMFVVQGSNEADIVMEWEDQMGELGSDFWSNHIYIDDVTERVIYVEDVDRFRDDILSENPDMDESEAEAEAERMADAEAEMREDLPSYLDEMGYGDTIPDFVSKDYEGAWKRSLSYDYDVIYHDGEMYVFSNNYSVGGTILSGMIGAYIGYKYSESNKGKKRGRKSFGEGGSVKDELYVAEYGGSWTIKDKLNPKGNYTLSSKKERAEQNMQFLIDNPSRLAYYRKNEYAEGGGVKDKIKVRGFAPVSKEEAMLLNEDFKENFNSNIERFTKHLNKVHNSKLRVIDTQSLIDFGKKYANGGMTEHGLKVGDRIEADGKTFGYKDEIQVIDSDKKRRFVNLDKGKRYDNGGGVENVRVIDLGKVTKVVGDYNFAKIIHYTDAENLRAIYPRGYVVYFYKADGTYIKSGLDKYFQYENEYKDALQYAKENVNNIDNEKYAKGGGVSGLNDLIRG